MKELTSKQQRTIALVVTSRSIHEGLKLAKTSKTTFYEWMKDPDFAAALEQQKKDIVQAAYDLLRNALSQAAEALIALLKSPDEKVRRMTAVNVIELYSKHVEIEQIEQRLKQLEQKLSTE